MNDEHSVPPTQYQSQPDRRSVLAKFVIGGMTLIGAGLAGLAGLVAAPKATGPERRWRKAMSSSDVSSDQPTPAVLVDRHADGWYETRKQTVVFIDRDGNDYRALSAVCQHLGCRVRWDDNAKQFRCPCHGGVYDRDGRVIAGPPPRPLERFKVRVNPQTSDVEVEL